MSGIIQKELAGLSLQPQLGPRRRRMPSIYAEGISQLKKITQKVNRKYKNSDQVSGQSQVINRDEEQKNCQLQCILPSSRRTLKLNIIIKKSRNIKQKQQKAIVGTQLQKTPPTQPKSQNLLDALFKLCEEHKVNQELKSKDTQLKVQQPSMSNEGIEHKGHRTRKVKEDEEKYARMYEKYLVLNQKMDQLDIETVMI